MSRRRRIDGGPLKLDPRVAEVFLAQIEVWSAADDAAANAAATRRDTLLQELDAQQRDFIRTIGESLAQLAALSPRTLDHLRS